MVVAAAGVKGGLHLVGAVRIQFICVRTAASPAVTPYLVGHVLAHEIVHMMQGVDVHSSSGLMKARWDNRDYVDMQRGHLKLAKDDIELIDHGLEWRASRAATAEGPDAV